MAPWAAADAKRHTKKAKSPKRKRQWAIVADSVLARTGDEGRAVRAANSAVKKSEHKRKISKHTTGAHRKTKRHKKAQHKKIITKR